MSGAVARRVMLRVALGAVAVLGIEGDRDVAARRYRKRRRKRCRHRCKGNRKTCDRACNILDGDSQELCKQGCRVAQSQCRSNCQARRAL